MIIQHRYSNIACFFDINSEISLKIYSEINNTYPMIGRVNEHFQLPKYNKQLIITLGGDGMMLKALHAFIKQNVDIYGINLGSIGFLLNEYTLNTLLDKISTSIMTKLYPLEIRAITATNEILTAIAFNEVSLLRNTSQTAKMQIKINGKITLYEMSGDGIMVATAAGSTAYNAAAGGPIIPLNTNILLLTPINPFRPRRFKSVLLPRQSVVSLDILEASKRPVSAFADSYEIKDVIRVEIYERNDINMSILFDKDLSLDDRILKEQFSS